MKRIGLVGLALFLVIMLWGGVFSKTVLSQQTESRFYNLEADFNRLESRVSQIEARLGQTNRVPSGVAMTPPSSSRSRRTEPQSERDKMFDRLATLVIELKQQVNHLEGRVGKLEKR